MTEITRYNATCISNLTKRRVAIYARVSSDKDAAENSLDSQTKYFLKKISDNPTWVCAGIYTENGVPCFETPAAPV